MNIPTKPLDQLLQKEMNRKEFLLTLGLGTASMFGFSTIIKLLTGRSVESRLTHRVSGGYGSSAYGGNKE
jgi:hypothetical protein